MAEFTPHFAPVVVLLFLGTGLVLSACFLLLFYGAARRSSFIAMLAGGLGTYDRHRVSAASGRRFLCQ
jgi:uncharacterized membrane protein YjjP (DUF1212 family)